MHTQILHTCTQCNCAWYLFFWTLPLFLPFACFRNSTRLKLQRKNCRKNSFEEQIVLLRYSMPSDCPLSLLNTMHIKIHKTMKDNEYPEENTQWAESHDTGGPKERDHQDIQSAIYWRSVPVAANCAWNLRMCTATFCIMGTSSSEILIRLYWTKDW